MIIPDVYDSFLVPAIFEPWSRELINRAKVFSGDKVLDVATRTGIVACRIAAKGATVTGLDSDASLLVQAQRRATDEGVTVKWMEGSPDALPVRAPAFDLVTCQQGLQLVPDPAVCARELRRVINPGGRAVVACWASGDSSSVLSRLSDIAQRRLGAAPHAGLWNTSLGDEATVKKLLDGAKFFAVAVETVTRQVRISEPERFARVSLASTVTEPDPGALDEAVTEATAVLESSMIEGAFPMTSIVAVGRVKT